MIWTLFNRPSTGDCVCMRESPIEPFNLEVLGSKLLIANWFGTISSAIHQLVAVDTGSVLSHLINSNEIEMMTRRTGSLQ